MLLNQKQKAVTFVDEVSTLGQDEEEVNFIGGGNFQNQGGFNRNFSGNQGGFRNYNAGTSNFTPNNAFRQNQGGYNKNFNQNEFNAPTAPPAPSQPAVPESMGELKDMFERIILGQQSTQVEFNKKLDDQMQFVNTKFAEVNAHLKKLDQQVAQTAEGLRKQTATLPGSTSQNPRQYVNAISTEFRNLCESGFEKEVVVEDLGLDEDVDEDIFAGKAQEKARKTISGDFVMQETEQGSDHQKPVAIATTPVWRSLAAPEGDKKVADLKGKITPLAPERVYIPIPPYPRCAKNYNAVVEKIGWQVPEVHKFRDLPCVKQYVDKAYQKELSINDAVDLIYVECAAILERQVPKKLADPGGFLLDCKIGDQIFDGVLCDSGSSVNVIPLSAAKGLGELQPCPLTITLADQSVRQPEGWLIDVPVEIGNRKILADFVVMKLDKEPKEPLILGRGFLATAGAVIDFKHGLVDLHLPGKTLHFMMDRGKEATMDGQPYQVNTISAVTLDEKMLDQGEEKEKMTDQPNLSTTSSTPATAIKQKAPNIKPPPSNPRYVFSKAKSKSKAKHTNAGKGSIPPKASTHPCSLPLFLGQPHAPTAYTPPWMTRVSKKHSMQLSKPPDI